MIEKWKRYCGGSTLLAWLTIIEVSAWLLATIFSIISRVTHYNIGIAQWLTLPSSFAIFLTRPWTLLTYMGIHFDVFHLLFNVLWLYWFGKILLYTLSDRDLAIYFIGGGISGGILFMVSAALGLGGGWLCGCSAAVLAVMCGAAIKHPDLEIRLFLIGNVKLKWVAILCAVLTFIGGGGNQAAHIGGLLWGLGIGFLGIPTLTKQEKRRRPDKMIQVLHDHRTDMQRLDALLDKIKLSGYDSLSRRERSELNELSKRIKK